MDFLKLRNAFSSARRDLAGMRKQLGDIETEREYLKTSSPTREELVEHAFRHLEGLASDYPQCVAEQLSHYMKNPLDPVRPEAHDDGTPSVVPIITATRHTTVLPGPKTLERAILYLLGEQIKPRLREAIMTMPLSGPEGPPMSKRIARFTAVNAQIADLKAQIAEAERILAGAETPALAGSQDG